MKTTWVLIAVSWAVLTRFGADGALGAERTVAIRDDFFAPRNLRVDPGDTVRWVHEGVRPHTTTSKSNVWTSGLMNNGDSFSVTFSDLGSFPYFCQVHGQSMSGKITVSSAGSVATQEVFLVTLNGRCRTTNSAGSLITVAQNTKSFLAECAEENGRDPGDLALVYDVEADAIVAVDRSDGSAVCTVAAFVGGTSLPTPDGARRERQAFVLFEDSAESNGSMTATERSTRGDGGELLKFSLRGSLQFGVHAHEGMPSKIFTGTFSTGRRFVAAP